MNLTNKTRRHFIQFLQDNNAYEAFVANLTANGWTEDEYFTDFEQAERGNLLLGGFTFVKTPEGQDFWCDLHDSWCKEMKVPNYVLPKDEMDPSVLFPACMD